jgi:hypothetical protein
VYGKNWNDRLSSDSFKGLAESEQLPFHSFLVPGLIADVHREKALVSRAPSGSIAETVAVFVTIWSRSHRKLYL